MASRPISGHAISSIDTARFNARYVVLAHTTFAGPRFKRVPFVAEFNGDRLVVRFTPRTHADRNVVRAYSGFFAQVAANAARAANVAAYTNDGRRYQPERPRAERTPRFAGYSMNPLDGWCPSDVAPFHDGFQFDLDFPEAV